MLGSDAMKTLVGLIPLAVVLVVAGAGIWWLLTNHSELGKWVLAGALVAHGLIHGLFLAPAPAAGSGPAWPFNFAQSWLSGAGLGTDPVRIVGTVLVIAVAAAFVVSGLATAGVVVPTSWWRSAVAVAAVLSAVMLAVYFDPQLVLGLAIDGALLWLVVTAAWTPAMAQTA
jgi:hypothetical protein